jgi:hypothetical protein
MSDQGYAADGGEQFSDAEGQGFYGPEYGPEYGGDELSAAQADAAELEAQLNDVQREREAEALVDEHPELNDPANAMELVQTSARLAEALGAPELSNSPAWWARVYEAQQQLAGGDGYRPVFDAGDQIISGSSDGNAPLGRRVLPW